MSAEDERARRARARASWPIRITSLDAAESDDLSATTTVAERIEMVAALTREAWALTGRPMPTYGRADIPVRIIRPTPEEPTPDEPAPDTEGAGE